ncbi:probable receptor-like protein kinase At5g39020 [Lycium barbarum]|uniref:probable receptor-like protein kinase At5g39020 n=1 Tax=Lycium barbarum TaxID=112863 RepID=UPI00293F3213|nr:probable receptor-like protein kinase At5g39020 [Lycium barbarum]
MRLTPRALGLTPRNILLNEDFCPKISDFGLAKLCNKKESIVSLLGARGTIGYIAPEIVYNNIGGVSHKSDVYSYGMMVLEMVGGRKNVDVVVDHTSEIYFPHWIYKQIEQKEELALTGIVKEDDKKLMHDELLFVYEYIPKGTVAVHLHENLAVTYWPVRMSLAIETASPLAYL